MYDIVSCERCGSQIPSVAAYCARCGAQRTPATAASAVASPNAAAPAAADGEFVECARCAEPIRAHAKACRFCGHVVGAAVETKPLGADTNRVSDHFARVLIGEVKSPGLAAFLSFLCPGLGQVYAGNLGRGIAIFVVPAFVLLALSAIFFPLHGLVLSFGIVLFGFHVWQIFDAYACAAPRRLEMTRSTRLRRRRA